MEKAMKARKIPSTDSIDELARFWDTHQLTQFDDELEEVSGLCLQAWVGYNGGRSLTA